MTTEPEKVIKILIEHGAYVNVMNDRLQTPLFSAVTSNNIIAASTLLELEADTKIKDSEGYTAFDLIGDYDDWITSEFLNTDAKIILKSKLD